MNQRGMTLLEVLIAAMISTLVLGSAFWLLSGAVDTDRRIARRTAWEQDYFVIAKRLRAELTGAFFSPRFADSFQGEAKRVSFFYPTGKGLAQVLWESREDGIYYRRREPGARDWREFKLSAHWQGSFSYLSGDGGWLNTWDSKEEKALPQMVRLDLTGRGSRRLSIALEGGRVMPY
jgi:prepilin-type N-terminal cleavage/methylation domain-containing protein